MNNNQVTDVCYGCGVTQPYGTMEDVNENDFDIFCNDCHPNKKVDILEENTETKLLYLAIHQMYEVDRGLCNMTTEDWIQELAKCMNDPDYKQKFWAEYREYRKAMDA